MDNPLGKFKDILMARAVDEEIRNKRKNSGGAVTAILIYLLETKVLDGVVILEARKGLKQKLVVARTRSELLRAVGSVVHVTPDMKKIKGAVLKHGFQNCGVIVTPCQAEGIGLMQQYPMMETEFASRIRLVIGSFCYGAFTQKSFQIFLKEKQGLEPAQVRMVEVVSDFLVITLKTGEVIKFPASVVLEHTQTGCLICHDFTATESDISAGVIPTHPGYTSLIVRSEFGEDALKEAVMANYLEIAPLKMDKSLIENMTIKMAEEKIRRAEKLSLMG